jgi:metal-responsive CopG/Arc/MetJ family transcriptional regulator
MTTLEVTIKLTENEVAEIDRVAQLEQRTREEVLLSAARAYTRRYRHRRDDPEIQRAMKQIDALAAKSGREATDSTAVIRHWRDTRR